MLITDAFDRVVVLNLPYKQDRKQRLTANMQATGIADLSKVVWQPAVSGDKMPPPAWWNAGNGAWGCLMSHVMAVQQAAIDGINSILILEDDAVFDPESPYLLSALHRQWPSQWGQIYLGGQHLGESEPVGDLWLKPGNVNRTHAFALHSSVFAAFIAHVLYAPDYISRTGGWHVDHQLGIAHERNDWSVFAPKWWLVGQAAGDSNISGKNNPEQWWQPIPESFESPVFLLPAGMKNTDPVYQAHCHAGHNLYRLTCEDTGADKALREGGGISRFLDSITGEATWHHRLPCVQHPEYTKTLLKGAKWPGKVHQIKNTAEIPALHRAFMRDLRAEVLK